MSGRWISLVSSPWTMSAVMATLALAASLATTFGDDGGHATAARRAARTAIYFDPDRSGEGLFIESLGDDRAVVYVLTYATRWLWDWWEGPIAELPSQPIWLIGLGQFQGGLPGDRLVADLVMPTGGQFGDVYDPEKIDYIPFGSLIFHFPTCGTSEVRGSLEIQPDAYWAWDYEAIQYQGKYVQLSQVIDCETGLEKATASRNQTGSWYNAARPGEGLLVQVLENDRAIVVWMTYDKDGRQMWLMGSGTLGLDPSFPRLLNIDDMRGYSGSFWGSDFNAAEVTSSRFGSVSLYFSGCIDAQLSWDSADFGSGSLTLTRLTWPQGVNPYGSGCWDY